MMPGSRARDARQAQAALQYALGSAARANPIVMVWRWRYELVAAAGLAAAWIVPGAVAGAAITAGLAALLAGVAASPRGRRILMTRAWCILTPHRVRVGCAQAWIYSANGKPPAVLATTSQPFGERVHLWCRAGTSAADIWSARELLAAACWAHDIRVIRHPRYAHLVALDVIRQMPSRPPDDAYWDDEFSASASPPPPLYHGQSIDGGYGGSALDDGDDVTQWPWHPDAQSQR
jgi:hypothetical protein